MEPDEEVLIQHGQAEHGHGARQGDHVRVADGEKSPGMTPNEGRKFILGLPELPGRAVQRDLADEGRAGSER